MSDDRHPHDPYEPHIAQSTIDAAVYLILHAPARLNAWLSDHYPDGKHIERRAREQIAAARKRRGAAA